MSEPDRSRALAASCGLLAAALALLVPLVASRLEPGYSHRAQFISELGAQGAAHGAVVSVAGFGTIGVLVLAFLVLAHCAFPATRRTTAGIFGVALVGVAYLIAAVFRCDAGCPAEGSLSQLLHNGFGLLEYVGAIVGFALLASAFSVSARWRPFSRLSAGCALVVAVALVAMLTPALAPERGISQRVAEVAIFGWIAVVARHLRAS